jgi:uncharacterized protein (DUF1015 family)
VSLLEPFPARIVRPEWAEHVVSPMHDVLTQEEREAIMADRPYSWLHVSRTPDDVPDGHDIDLGSLAEANATSLRRLLDAGLFEDFPEPALYVYRIRSPGHTQTGVVGEVPHEAFVEGRVLGHEGVQQERVDALETHLERVGAASTLVALMFRADDDVRKVVEAATEEPALRRFGREDLEQTVWRIDDPDAIDRIRERLDRQVLYITDGHHRAKASVDVWERAGRPASGGVPAVLFPDDELRMLAFHRRVVGPLAMGVDDLLARLRERVSVEEVTPDPSERGAFGLYVDGRWYRLVLPHDGSSGGVGSLDVTRLHREILEPILGFGPAGDPGLEFVSAAVPVEELTGRVDDDHGAAFTLVAPTFEQFVDVADRREQMPAKATFFDPKPQAGLFLSVRNG